MASEKDHVSSSQWRIFVTHLQRNFIVAVGPNETIFNLKKEILKSYDVINSSYGERTSCFSGSSSSLSPSCIGLFLLNNYELCNHNIVADVLFDGASVITSHADPSSVGMVQNHPYQPNPSPACINQFPYPLSTSVPFNYQRPMLLSQSQKSLSQFNISTARGGDFFDDLSRRPTCTSELGTRGPVPRSEIEIREPRTEFKERDTAPEDIAIDKERIKEKEHDPPPHPPLHPSTHEEEEEEEHTESERERVLPAGATTVPPPPAPVKGKRKAEPSLTDNTKAKKKKRISKKKDENTIPSTCTEDDEDTPTITGETSKVTKRSKKKQTTSSSKKMEAKTRKEDPVVPAVDMTKSDKNKSEKVSKKRQTTSTSKKTETKTRKEDSLSRSFVRELLSASSDEGVPVPIAQLVEDKTEKVGKEREEALEEQREQEKESDGNVVKEKAPIIQTASPPHTRSKNKRESKTASKASTTAAATKKQPKKLALSKTLRKKTPTTAAAVHTPPLIVPADSTETKQDPPNKTKQVLTNKSKAKTVTIIDMLSESEEEEDEEEDEGGEGGKSAGAPGQEKNKTPEVYTLASPSLSFSSSSDEDDEDITDKEGHPSIKTVAINTGNTVATGNTGGNTMDTGNTRDTGSNDSLSEEEEEKENVNETPKASQELFSISKEVEGREGSEEIPIQIPLHKVKTTIPPTTPKKSAASNEDNEESSSNVSSSEEEEEEEREARKGGAVPSALSALVIDANPPSKKTAKKTSVVIPFKSKFQHKLKSSPAAIMPNKLAQKRKQQQTRKIGGIEQVTADEERLSQSLSQDDLSQMIANNESVWAV